MWSLKRMYPTRPLAVLITSVRRTGVLVTRADVSPTLREGPDTGCKVKVCASPAWDGNSAAWRKAALAVFTLMWSSAVMVSPRLAFCAAAGEPGSTSLTRTMRVPGTIDSAIP